jgi:hypothetical protein
MSESRKRGTTHRQMDTLYNQLSNAMKLLDSIVIILASGRRMSAATPALDSLRRLRRVVRRRANQDRRRPRHPANLKEQLRTLQGNSRMQQQSRPVSE